MTHPPHDRAGALCELLGIDRPVLLAPMARIAGAKLASAVSGAGGLGYLGAGYGDAGWLEAQMAEMDPEVVFGVGLITWHMADGAVDDVLTHRPGSVWLSFGDPAEHIETIHGAGALAVCQVGRVSEAVAAADAGADVLVAQGSEAGGHGRKGRSLFGLLPAIADAVPTTPLVAAGGINDLRGYRAATELGAWGVALGTALYGTTEAVDTEEAKARLVELAGDDTVQSTVYDHIRGPVWPSEYTGRSARTPLTDEWAGREDALAAADGPDGALTDLKRRYPTDVAESNMDRRVLWAGEGVEGVTDIVPAAEVIARFPTAR